MTFSATAPGYSILHTKVLILNRSYLPIHVTSVKRAFVLLYQGIAKAVNEQYQTFDFDSWSDLSIATHYETVGMVNRVIRVPRVILLVSYDRVPKRQVRFSRFNIYARDKLTCQYCHRRLPRQELNLDHVIPRSQGGVSVWENVVCSCHECNRRKGGRTPQQAGMLLKRNPVRPAVDAVHAGNLQPVALPRVDPLPQHRRRLILEYRTTRALASLGLTLARASLPPGNFPGRSAAVNSIYSGKLSANPTVSCDLFLTPSESCEIVTPYFAYRIYPKVT